MDGIGSLGGHVHGAEVHIGDGQIILVLLEDDHDLSGDPGFGAGFETAVVIHRIDAVAQLAVRTAPLTMRSWDVLGKRWYYVGMVTISGTLLPGAFLLSMTAV